MVKAQHDFYVGAQTDFGTVSSPSFNIDNSLLKKKNISPHIGGLLSLHYRFYDMFAIEAGIGQHWNNTRLRDPSFESQYDGFSVKFNNKNYHWNYYLALSSMVRIGFSKTYIYGKVGYSFNQYGEESITKTKEFLIPSKGIDQVFSTTTNYQKSNYSIIPELGVQQKITNRNLISAGIKVNMGQSNAMQGVYTITDNVTNTTIQDNIRSEGNYVSINFRYDMLLYHIPKKEKAKREKKKIDEVPVVKTKKDPSAKVEDRKLNVTHKIKVHAPKVTVYVWDHQSVDGDIISVNLNGEWVLKEYTLEKEKHSFEVELKEGKNIFVLHALNLGEFKPNTAAIMVMDGYKVEQIILESNLNESGTLEINYKPKK